MFYLKSLLEFLRFLYENEAQIDDLQFAIRLLGFSDKYLQDDLHKRCINFLKNNLTIDNVSELIQYLDQQSTPDLELKDSAFDLIIDNATEVFQEDNMNAKFFEEFLIKNITMDTIVKIADILDYPNEEIPQEKTINLRKACFEFARKNFKSLHEKNIPEEFSKAFLSGVILYMAETQK